MILVVTGLAREARIAAGPGLLTLSGGGRAQALGAAIAQALAAGGVRGVLSFGVAGALSPALRVGDVALAATVRDAGRTLHADAAWTARLAARTGARLLTVAGVDAVAATPQAKAALRAQSGAALVDMESHLAARAAAAHGLPFAVLRVVSDRAEHGLPPAALAGMGADGGVDAGAVLAALTRHPGQLPALVRTGLDAGRAFRALAAARHAAGADLGPPDAPAPARAARR